MNAVSLHHEFHNTLFRHHSGFVHILPCTATNGLKISYAAALVCGRASRTRPNVIAIALCPQDATSKESATGGAPQLPPPPLVTPRGTAIQQSIAGAYLRLFWMSSAMVQFDTRLCHSILINLGTARQLLTHHTPDGQEANSLPSTISSVLLHPQAKFPFCTPLGPTPVFQKVAAAVTLFDRSRKASSPAPEAHLIVHEAVPARRLRFVKGTSSKPAMELVKTLGLAA